MSKDSSHWKRTLKLIFKGSGCFQFHEAVITSAAKESLRSSKHTNFGGRDSKPMLKMSVVIHCQDLLCLDTYNTDAIAINKLYFRYFTLYLAISQ